MKDEVRFHNMTKPLKFRGFRLAKQILVDWFCSVGEVIRYNFNYLLYKLNILKRYSYRDNVEEILPLPHHLNTKEVETDIVKGTVVTSLVKETFYDMDYFYKQNKDGSKKITYYIKDKEEHKLFLESHLENIHLKVFDEWYCANNLPTLKVAFMDVPPTPTFIDDYDAPLKRFEDYETKEFNLLPLRMLKFQSFLGKMEQSDISEPMLHYYYNIACDGFTKRLKSLSLHDLMLNN